MPTLLGTWHSRVSAGTGWPGVSILRLVEIESLSSSVYLSVAEREKRADPPLRYTSTLRGTSTNQPTNQQLFDGPRPSLAISASSTDSKARIERIVGVVQPQTRRLPQTLFDPGVCLHYCRGPLVRGQGTSARDGKESLAWTSNSGCLTLRLARCK